MAISRRTLLTHSVMLAGRSILPGARLSAANHAFEGAFASAFSNQRDEHFVAILNRSGTLIREYAVHSRGHSACVSSDRRYTAFFARRPRRWLLLVDIASGDPPKHTKAIQNRHYYGHGVFSPDNSLLFATENDYINNQGVIGNYEVKTGERIHEIQSFGAGPHELALLADGKTLVVANGGIETHPDYGRRKLNLDSMSPSLTYIDLQSGKKIVAAQYQGSVMDELPLVFSHKGHTTLQPMAEQPALNLRRINRYVASVALSDEGRIAVTSAPKGDLVSVWGID